MRRTAPFGDLEAMVMDRLWNDDGHLQGVTPHEILPHISAHPGASCSAVAASMENLCSAGWLRRVRTGSELRYEPTLTREQHSARLIAAAGTDGPCTRPAITP